jgi:hypothetical protein
MIVCLDKSEKNKIELIVTETIDDIIVIKSFWLVTNGLIDKEFNAIKSFLFPLWFWAKIS